MKIQFSYKTRKNRKKLPTALCKKRGKLLGGGGEKPYHPLFVKHSYILNNSATISFSVIFGLNP